MSESLKIAVAAYLTAIDAEPEKDIWDTWDGKHVDGADKTSSDFAWAAHGQKIEASLAALRVALEENNPKTWGEWERKQQTKEGQ